MVGNAEGVRSALQWLAAGPFKEGPLKMTMRGGDGDMGVTTVQALLAEQANIGSAEWHPIGASGRMLPSSSQAGRISGLRGCDVTNGRAETSPGWSTQSAATKGSPREHGRSGKSRSRTEVRGGF